MKHTGPKASERKARDLVHSTSPSSSCDSQYKTDDLVAVAAK